VTEPRIRREPPRFRSAEVAHVDQRSPRLVRVTFTGDELADLDIGLPASSIRVLVPPPGGADRELPRWNGNEFLYDDGSRPPIRTVTPLRLDPFTTELDVEIVRHGEGPLATFAESARPGHRVAISGTGRGYEVDPAARSFLLAGDESALPAIGVLLPNLPAEARVHVIVEIGSPEARIDLPAHPGASVDWVELPPGARAGEALVGAVTAAETDPEARVWAAGEAAAVQRIRRHLFEDRGLQRSQAVVRGYWKHGRSGAGG
jgi:NADPH-dependent ferric siderophore reductase